jgi:CheY-like chemotaxis protein
MTNTKILIVEDEAIVALEIQDRLLSLGYEICCIASSGEKAISIAETALPDLVLMDIKLKGKMNGIETAKIIKEKLGISSIFITAFSDENTLKQINELFHFECLFKPFEEEDLKNAVGKSLKKSR